MLVLAAACCFLTGLKLCKHANLLAPNITITLATCRLRPDPFETTIDWNRKAQLRIGGVSLSSGRLVTLATFLFQETPPPG